MKKYVCTICGYVYDEASGIPSAGIKPGTKWEDVPNGWVCPLCGATKADFKEQKVESTPVVQTHADIKEDLDKVHEFSFGELSALCSNLAKGCEKQYLSQEMELFNQLSEYFNNKVVQADESNYDDLIKMVQNNLNEDYTYANAVANSKADRGALRALVWSEKVTRILNSLLTRYNQEGDSMLENTNIYVCEICGFIYVGDEVPDICPVCKVPNLKITKLQRR